MPSAGASGTGTASLSTPGPALSWGSNILSREGRLCPWDSLFSLESEGVEGGGINPHPDREGNPGTTRCRIYSLIFYNKSYSRKSRKCTLFACSYCLTQRRLSFFSLQRRSIYCWYGQPRSWSWAQEDTVSDTKDVSFPYTPANPRSDGGQQGPGGKAVRLGETLGHTTFFPPGLTEI